MTNLLHYLTAYSFSLIGLVAPAAAQSDEKANRNIRIYEVKQTGEGSKYWTDERMRAATPTPLLPSETGPALQEPADKEPRILSKPFGAWTKPDVLDDSKLKILDRRAVPVKNGAESTPVLAPNGKLFYKNGGRDMVCSAAAVSPDLAITAAHCVYDRDTGKLSSDIQFSPQYNPAGSPYKFSVRHVYYPEDWEIHGYRYADHAFLRIDGKFPDAVGYYGIISRPNTSVLPAGELGYPAETPFPGNKLHLVVPVEPTPSAPDAWQKGIYSDMNGGSSGGVWLGHRGQDFGYVFGVNSNRTTEGEKIMYSPWFYFLLEGLWACTQKPTPDCK